MSGPAVVRTREEYAKAVLAGDGFDPAFAPRFIPTMGALHRGHADLIARPRRSPPAGPHVVSIFVNPTQFAPGEDLDRYPRTFEADVELCAAAGVHIVFAPSAEEMYPHGFVTTVHVGGVLTEVLEGTHRSGHFDGVATVVAKLFGIVRPSVSYFGEKDWQQLAVVRRMAADLELPGYVVGVPTVRDSDGLALSSATGTCRRTNGKPPRNCPPRCSPRATRSPPARRSTRSKRRCTVG